MSNDPPTPARPRRTLDELRQAIDQVDTSIQDLLTQRAELVVEVGELKSRNPGTVFYRPEREAQIHRRLEERHGGPMPLAAVHRIFREIISASLSIEKRLTIAYLGPEATFTHQAALKQFGSSCAMAPARDIAEVFREVEAERADFGVVPIENSSEGVVSHTLDQFVDSPLQICGEVLLPVVHHLFSGEPALEGVKVVYGHFQALAQCREWLRRHLPRTRLKEVSSTARALELARERPGSGAIAGVYAADNYGLNALADHIEDLPGAENRFLVIGRHGPQPSGADKTSLLFSFRDQLGILHQVLGIFAGQGINLTRIESRPSKRRAWDYVFFVDFEGHHDDPQVAQTLKALCALPGIFTKILGSYPRRVL